MNKTTVRRRTEDRERARQKILAAATHLFAERGLEDVTYGDIARSSGLSRPLVYFYFPDQEQLIQETFLAACRRLQERFIAAVAQSATGAESLMAIGRAYLHFHDDCPDEARLMLLEGAHCPPQPVASTLAGTVSDTIRARLCDDVAEALEQGTVATQMMEQKRSIIALVAGEVERGRADGSVRKEGASPTVIALNLWAFTHGLVGVRGQLGESVEAVHGVTMTEFLEHGFQPIQDALMPRGGGWRWLPEIELSGRGIWSP